MQIRSTARTVTITYIFHMQQGVHYTENTDATAVMWENKNKSTEELKSTIICRYILRATSWLNISLLQIWFP